MATFDYMNRLIAVARGQEVLKFRLLLCDVVFILQGERYQLAYPVKKCLQFRHSAP